MMFLEKQMADLSSSEEGICHPPKREKADETSEDEEICHPPKREFAQTVRKPDSGHSHHLSMTEVMLTEISLFVGCEHFPRPKTH